MTKLEQLEEYITLLWETNEDFNLSIYDDIIKHYHLHKKEIIEYVSHIDPSLFVKNYFDNFSNTLNGKDHNNLTHFNSVSIRVIYFLDYLTAKNKLKKKA